MHKSPTKVHEIFKNLLAIKMKIKGKPKAEQNRRRQTVRGKDNERNGWREEEEIPSRTKRANVCYSVLLCPRNVVCVCVCVRPRRRVFVPKCKWNNNNNN